MEGNELPVSLIQQKFNIDGNYFPRIYLMDPFGNIDTELQEPGAWEHFYHYSSPRDMLNNMYKIAERWEKKREKRDAEEL